MVCLSVSEHRSPRPFSQSLLNIASYQVNIDIQVNIELFQKPCFQRRGNFLSHQKLTSVCFVALDAPFASKCGLR